MDEAAFINELGNLTNMRILVYKLPKSDFVISGECMSVTLEKSAIAEQDSKIFLTSLKGR